MSHLITRLGNEFFPKTPGSSYFRILVVFVLLNAFSDFLFPILSQMGQINISVSPGELFRGLELFVLILMVGRLKCRVKDLSVAALFVILGLIFYAYYGGSYELTQRLLWATKFLYFVLISGLIRKIVHTDPAMANRVAHLLLFSMLLFLIIPIFTSYLGLYGFQFYAAGYRLGFKGFMFSGNSTSINAIAVMALPLAFSNSLIIRYMFIGAGFLIGTKASAVTALATLLLMLYFLMRSSDRKINFARRLLPVALFIGLVFFSWKIYGAIQSTNWEFYLGQLQRGKTFMWVLTSGRWGYFDLFSGHVAHLSILEWIYGTHYPTFNEMDFTALFTRFGLLGLLWYILFFSGQIKYAFYNLRLGEKSFIIAFSSMMIFFHSLLGGHVMGNAVVAYQVATIFILNEYYYKTRPRFHLSHA